jgi:hypothetical protein
LDVCEQCFDPLLCKIGRQQKEAPTIECVHTLLSEEEQEKEAFVAVAVAEEAANPNGSNGISFVEEHGSIGFETSFDDDASLRNNEDHVEENLEGKQDAESQSLTMDVVSEDDSEATSHVCERGSGAPNKGEAMGEETVTVCKAVCDVGTAGEAMGDTAGVAAVDVAGVTTMSDEERGTIRGEIDIVEYVSEQESESSDDETDNNLDTSDDDASIVQRERQIEEMRAHIEMRLESFLKGNSLIGLREQVHALRKSGLESECVVHKDEVFVDNESFDEEENTMRESSTILESSEMPRDPNNREKLTAYGNPETCRVHSKKHIAGNGSEEANCGIQSKNAVGEVVGDTIEVVVCEAVGEAAEEDAVGKHVGDEEGDGRGVTETDTHLEGKVSDVVSSPNEKIGYETTLEQARYDDRSETFISGHASVDEKNSTQNDIIAADANPMEGRVQGERRLSTETVSEQDHGYMTTLEQEQDDAPTSETSFSGNDACVDEKNGTQKTNPDKGEGHCVQSETRVSEIASFFLEAAAEAADCAMAQEDKGFIKRPFYLILLLHSVLSVFVVIACLRWNQYSTQESLAWHVVEQEFPKANGVIVHPRRAFVPKPGRLVNPQDVGNKHWKTALQEFRKQTTGAPGIQMAEQ